MLFRSVGAGEEGDERTGRVDEGQLALLAVAKDGVGFLEGDPEGSGDESVASGHDFGEDGRRGAELNVAGGDNADELAAESASVCAREEDQESARCIQVKRKVAGRVE